MSIEEKHAEALRRLFSYPLVDALAHRRSRRFSLGAAMPGGGLEYRSQHAPLPLTKTEESLLCFAAAGVSGLCLGDVPFGSGGLKEGGGGNVMAALTGRTGASADAVHSAALFVINDEGTYLWKRPQDFSLDEITQLAQLAMKKRFEDVYDRMRALIRPGRTAIEREVPFVFPFNKWDTNLPGTTYFVPVCDLSSMYINVILSGYDEQMALFVVDERNNFQPAGVAKFARSKGGKLHDDPKDNRIMPILGLEAVIVEFMMAEQSFMAHNLSLMEQALGLGGWTHFATATETGWLQALGFRLGQQSAAQMLRAGFFKRCLMNLLGKNPSYPHGLGLTVGDKDLIKPYCPPYYPTMEAAVLAYLDFKKANAWQAPLKPTYPGSWKDPKAISRAIPVFSDECIAATIAYCTYLYENYGRFPAYFGPMRTTLAHQAHHLDLDFYDKFYHYSAGRITLLREGRKWYKTNGFIGFHLFGGWLMDEQQLRQLKPELDRFLDDYAPLFGHDNNQAHARRFVQGLLHHGERRNTENIAEALQGGPVRTLQAFVATGAWQDGDLLSQMRRHLLEVLADEDAVWNSDETGFPKKGVKSVGVKRQYSGTLGRTDNCQVAVFANYASSKGHAFMDRRLFLPEEWAADAARREAAGVPADVIFRTKPALALEMVAQAVADGVPFRWVGGDCAYGDNPTFVQGVRALGKWYVLDISCDTLVWTEPPQVLAAADRPRPRRGRPPTKPLVVGERRRVDEVVAALPATAWRRVVVGEGSQGPRLYEYAAVAAWFCEDELPGPPERLLVRRSLGQSAELKYHRADAPAAIALEKLAQVRGTRWTIEEDIQCGKGECGLDEYETRGWVGWHHHTALSLLALAFLVLQRQRLGEKRTTANRPRSPRAARPSAGRAQVGPQGNPAVVGLAPRTKPQGGRQSSKAAARPIAAAAK